MKYNLALKKNYFWEAFSKSLIATNFSFTLLKKSLLWLSVLASLLNPPVDLPQLNTSISCWTVGTTISSSNSSFLLLQVPPAKAFFCFPPSLLFFSFWSTVSELYTWNEQFYNFEQALFDHKFWYINIWWDHMICYSSIQNVVSMFTYSASLFMPKPCERVNTNFK